MTLLLTLFITFTEQAVVYFIAANYTGKYVLARIRYLRAILGIVIIWALIFALFPDMHPVIKTLLGQIAAYCSCSQFEDKLKDKISICIITILTMFIIETPADILLVIGTQTGFLTNFYIRPLFAHAFTLVLIYFYFKTPFKYLYGHSIKTSFAYKTALVYFYLLMISIMIPIHANREFLYSDFQVYFFPVMLMLISSAVLLYYEKIISVKNADIDYYQKNMPIYEDLIQGIRTNQHEYANRMQSLNALLTESTDLNQIRRNLITYTSEYAVPIRSYAFLKLNMPLLAASLYSQSTHALSQDKTLNVSIHSYELHTKISEVLLSDLTNILIQNALENSKSNSVIYISIDSNPTTKQTSIEVRNPVERYITDSELADFFKSGYSTKESKSSYDNTHGYGLYVLSKTVHRKKGQLIVNCSEFEEQYWITIKFII